VYSELFLLHLSREPVHLFLGVAEDDGLRDRQRVVEIAKRIELPLLPLHTHEELLDSVKRKFITFHLEWFVGRFVFDKVLLER